MEYPQKNVPALSIPFVKPWSRLAKEHPGPGHIRTSTDKKAVLFTPLKLRGITLKNRIVVSPMCMYTSADGFMNDWHLVHYGALAKGGAALVIFEASAVQDIGRITPHCAGIWKDEHIAPMKRIADFIHDQGSLAGVQIAHAGRKASTYPPHDTFAHGRDGVADEHGGWEPVGPTQEPYSSETRSPHELNREEIKEVIKAFVDAAIRANKAGFDVLELHGAHGYLISTFYSPISNKRTDEYGGSFENRVRFCLEVATAVRNAWPQEKPLFVRLSCSDWVGGGWGVEHTVQLATLLKEVGVDVIDCSSGGISPNQQIPPFSGSTSNFQVPMAEAVKKESGIATMAVGGIRTATTAESILAEGKADLVAIGREMLRDQAWPLRAAQHFEIDVYHVPQHDWTVNRPSNA